MTPLDVDGSLVAFGLSLKNLIVGAVTSFVSLRFFDGDKAPDGTIRPMTKMQRWTTFIGGWALAAWGGPPLNSWLELSPKIEVGIVLLLGMFGMAAATETYRFIRDTDWKSVLPFRKGGN